MMRYVSKVSSVNSICKRHYQHLQVFNSFTLSNKKKSSKFQAQEPQKNSKPLAKGNPSLLTDILEILGTENLNLDRNPSGNLVSEDSLVGFVGKSVGLEFCTQGVCQNAHEKMPCSRDAKVKNSSSDDVSLVVHKITEIVRAEEMGISLEERLDKWGFEIDSDIVGKVLKRCFKVPNMAARFFNWVKMRNSSYVTTEVYNTMLYIAGEAKEFGLVEKLMEEMGSHGCEKDIKSWTILLVHYGKAKLIGKALWIFDKMRRSGCEPDLAAYRLMIRLLCAARKGEIAMEFYKEMVHKCMELDFRIYKLLLDYLAGSGDIAGAYSVADDMIKVSQIPEDDVYSCLLKSFCIAQRVTEALELIQDLKSKNLTFSLRHFEILVKGMCRADRIDDALEIVDIMKKRNVVSEVVYGALIDGYSRQNNLAKALELFESMKEAGLSPATSTYTKLMQHLFKANEYMKGCALFDEMLEKGVELDSVAFMAMVAGHIRHNNVSAAWEVFRSMEEKGIQATQQSYTIFIKEFCRTSMTDEIFKVLNKMQDSKISIGNDIFHCVISYLERKGEIAKIEDVKNMQRHLRLYHSEGEASGTDISSREIASIYSNKAEQKTECLLLEPLPNAFDNKDLHNISTVLLSSKDWYEMQEALEKCKICYTPALVMEVLRNCCLHGYAALHFFSWVAKQPDYSHTTETYNMAIKLAGQGKDFKHMRNLFHEMRRNGCLITSDTWTIMIMLYGRVGLTDIALRNFNDMKADGFNPNASTYKYLILSLCGRKGRKVDEAIKLFKEMISAGLAPDKELVEVYFNCLCGAGKLTNAQKCIESLRKVGFSTPLCYSMLIRALCRAGKLDEALALMDEVEEDRPTLDRYVHGSLVSALLQRGQLEEALDKVDFMRQAGVSPTAHVYTSLIDHFCKEELIEKALEIFKKMCDEGCKPTVITYTALMRGYMKTGAFAEAQKLFWRMKLKGPNPDFKTYSTMIRCLCDAGRSEDAFQLLYEMWDDGIVPSAVNFRTVFFGLNKEGKHHLAQKVLQPKRAIAYNRKLLT